MKNFIEVTYQGAKYCVNINQIVWLSALQGTGKAVLILTDTRRFTLDESYDELVAKIEAATAK